MSILRNPCLWAHVSTPVKMLPCSVLMGVIFLLFAPLSATAQFSSLTVGLRNDVGYFGTASSGNRSDNGYYSQFYDVSVNGFILDERLLQFNLSSSLTSRSSDGTSSGTHVSQKNRYLGYYNGSVTLFPNNHYPLTVFASRSDALNSGSNMTFGVVTPMLATTSELSSQGLRWSIAKNTYYPQIVLRLERNRQNTVGEYSWNQKNDNFSVDLSNMSTDGRSNYSFTYTTRNNTSAWLPAGVALSSAAAGSEFTWREQEFRLSVGSALSDDFTVQANGQYFIRNLSTQQITDLTGRWQQSSRATHHLKIQLTNYFLPSQRSGRFGSLNVSDHMNLQISSRLQGVFGISHLSQFRRMPGYADDEFQQQYLSANVNYVDNLSVMDFSATIGTDVGQEGFTGAARKLMHRSTGGVQGSLLLWNLMRVTGAEQLSYSRTYYIGRTMQNDFFLKSSTNILAATTLEIEARHNYLRYFDNRYFGTLQTTQLNSVVRTQSLLGFSVEAQYSHQWITSSFPDQVSQIGLSIMRQSFARGLYGQLSVSRQYFKRTQLIFNRAEAFVGYQLYAFSVRLRATLWSQRHFRTQGISMDISRPFSFDFR